MAAIYFPFHLQLQLKKVKTLLTLNTSFLYFSDKSTFTHLPWNQSALLAQCSTMAKASSLVSISIKA